MEEKFMDEAVRVSRKHMESGEGGPFGCVIVKDGQIVGVGWNNVLSSGDPTAHAEVCAIRDACRNLNTYQLTGCELYTTCEPCPMCLGAIYWARPDKIYYANTREDAAAIGFDDAFIYEEINQEIGKRKIAMLPMDKTKALEVFKIWSKKKDKVSY
jgi:guanine deaminase